MLPFGLQVTFESEGAMWWNIYPKFSQMMQFLFPEIGTGTNLCFDGHLLKRALFIRS
jgi:hypothetical protein